MNELYAEVEAVRGYELKRIGKQYGEHYRSSHEAYGIIKEEAEESVQAANEAFACLQEFWDGVKINDEAMQRECLDSLKRNAQLAACEMIQLAATAEKAMRGYSVPVTEIPKGTKVRVLGKAYQIGEEIRANPCAVFINLRRRG